MRRRILKFVLWAALAAALFAAAATAACWRYGNALVSYFKPTIERLASDATGFDISFSTGSVRLLPFIRVVLHEGSLVSRHGCAPWSVEEASFRIRILPLLRMRLDVASIKLAGLRGAFAMHRGVASLADSSGAPCQAQEPAPSQAASPGARPVAKPPESSIDLNVSKLLITSSELSIFGFETAHTLRLDEVLASVRLVRGGLSLPKLDITGTFDAVPLTFDLRDVMAYANGARLSASGEVGLGSQRMQARGSYDRLSQSGELALSLTDVSLGEDEELFADGLPKMRGTVSGSIAAQMKADEIVISGNLSLADGSAYSGDSFKAHNVSLRSLSATVKGGELVSARTNLLVEKFHCVDGDDSYSAGRVDGNLSLSKDAGTAFAATLSVQDFGFKDEDTTITKARALLKDLSGKVSASGDTTVGLTLDASSIYLTNPNIIVNSVSSVRAPLSISIPAAGGYSVSGPVTIAGGVLTLQGRTLERTGGTIEMLVSSPLKDFRSASLSTTSAGQQVGAKTHFAMTKGDYKISDTTFSLGRGAVSAELSVGRRGDREFTASMQAAAVPVASAYRALMQEDGAPIKGSIESFSAKLSGNRKDLERSLAGEGALVLSNAVIQTVDIQRLIRKAIASIPLVGTSLVPRQQPLQVQDGSIAASFTIKDGQVRVPDLQVEYSNLKVEANIVSGFDSSLKGTAKVIFLQETFRLLGFGFDKLGNFLAREGRVAVPLILGRTVSDPSVDPDMEEIGKFISGVDLVESIASGVESLTE